MRYIAAYALLVLSGIEKPKPFDVEKVLRAVGATVDGDKIKALCKAFDGKDFHQLTARDIPQTLDKAVKFLLFSKARVSQPQYRMQLIKSYGAMTVTMSFLTPLEQV